MTVIDKTNANQPAHSAVIQAAKNVSQIQHISLKALVINLFQSLGDFFSGVSGVIFYYRSKADAQAAKAINGLAINQLKAVQAVMLKNATLDSLDDPELHMQIQKIRELIDNPPERGLHDHLSEIRRQIDKALRMGCKLQDHPYVEFLHELSEAFLTRSEVGDVYRKIGEEQYRPNLETDWVAQLDERVAAFPIVSKDSLIGKIFHAILYPRQAWNSLASEIPSTARNYISYDNMDVRIGAYEVNKKKVHFSQGAGGTGDLLMTAHLQHLREKNGQVVHLQQVLEWDGRKGESLRRQALIDLEDVYPEFYVFATPMDGSIWKGEGQFGSFESVRDFYSELEKHMNGESGTEYQNRQNNATGFYIPDKVLSSDEVNAARAAAQAFFESLDHTPYWKSLSPQRQSKLMLVVFESMLATKAQTKITGRDDVSEAHFWQRCKENVDRGTVLNVMGMVLPKIANGQRIEEQDIQQYFGAVLARPLAVGHRGILHDRYEALSDFLHLVTQDGIAMPKAVADVYSGVSFSF